MVKRLLVAAACLAVLLSAAPAFAQQSATLVLKSGERISGELVDMGGTDFTMRVNGNEQRVPIHDVAVIDFVGGGQGLPATELQAVTGERHILILKGGESFQGRLFDISGTTPLRLIFDVDGGRREVTSAEVGRIYLARPPGSPVPTTGTATPAPAPLATGGPGMAVPANTPWTPTGIVVRKGDMVSFQSSGEIRLSTDPDDIAGPAGARSQRLAVGSPLPGNFAGALIGRIGSGAPFPIGDQTSALPMPGAGQLFLGINDDEVSDNVGQFNVVITRQSSRRR